MIKPYPLRMPALRKLPDKSDLSLWIKLCNWNRKSVMVWNSRFFPTISQGQPSYGCRYDIKSVSIGVEDYNFFKQNLHPTDFERYSPLCDSQVPKGTCLVDIAKLYKTTTLLDTEFSEDLEYRLMEKDEWQLE